MSRLLDMTTRELIIGTLALLLWLAFLLMLFYLV